MRTKSQEKQIERDLRKGKRISPMQALRDYGTMRLAARIHSISKTKHLNIKSKMVFEGDMKWAVYFLAK